MNKHFFLYEDSLEEKKIFLNKITENLGDLIFVFDLHSSKVIYHNGRFQTNSQWEEILSSPNILDAINNKLYSIDKPVFSQLVEKLNGIADRDIIVRDLHILTEPNVYGHYQLEISLFDKGESGKPMLIKCRVHTIQEQNILKDLFLSSTGFSKIILVDDDELTNILSKKIINSVLHNVAIEIFLDIDDALDWLRTNDKNGDLLIFLDINFPSRSGWDFLEEYQQFSVMSKVIMISSSIVQSDKIKALSYKNVLQFLSKPLSFNFLETVLK